MKMSGFLGKIKKAIEDPNARWCYMNALGLCGWMDDETFLKKQFHHLMGYELDLKNPKTFNEKIQWLKVNNRKPEYTMMVDKYAVRQYIADTIGEEYLIPLLGVWDDPEQIDFDALPNQFVLKCNHNSGLGMCICKDKSSLDIKKVKKELKKGLRQNYYSTTREFPYRDVKRKIVCEKYMVDESGMELKDYKTFVFGGKLQYIQVDYDRFTNHHRNFYDKNWNYVPFTTLYPTNPDRHVPKPECLDEMIAVTEKLANAIGNPPFIRLDWYVIKDRIFFGEITFFHGAGYEKFSPDEYDKTLGERLILK